MEQEILDKINQLIAVRNEILDLNNRQRVIEASIKALTKEREDNYHEISQLGEKGKDIIKELVVK